jgi:hypothetical protein
VLLAAAAAVVALTYPGGVSAACEDFQQFRQNARRFDTERDRDAVLSDRSVLLHDRINAKQAIVEDVIGGRVELGEAARLFLELTVEDETAMAFVRGRYDGSTDLEKYARNVIDHVSGQVPSADKAAVLTRLNRQLRDRFGAPGGSGPTAADGTGHARR